MHWLPKMHKTLIDLRLIVAFKACSTKGLCKIVSKVFKMICNHMGNFHT